MCWLAACAVEPGQASSGCLVAAGGYVAGARFAVVGPSARSRMGVLAGTPRRWTTKSRIEVDGYAAQHLVHCVNVESFDRRKLCHDKMVQDRMEMDLWEIEASAGDRMEPVVSLVRMSRGLGCRKSAWAWDAVWEEDSDRAGDGVAVLVAAEVSVAATGDTRFCTAGEGRGAFPATSLRFQGKHQAYKTGRTERDYCCCNPG